MNESNLTPEEWAEITEKVDQEIMRETKEFMEKEK